MPSPWPAGDATSLHRVTPEALTRLVAEVLDAEGAVHGSAFLVEPDVMVTCAHVLDETGVQPGDEVAFRFPNLGAGAEVRGEVEAGTWQPADGGDLAFARLLEPPPPGALPLPLWSATRTAGREVRTFGFPARVLEGGQPAGGRVLLVRTDPVAGSPTALDVAEANAWAPGFSGAPVLDVASGMVVGVVSSIPGEVGLGRLRDAAYAIPADLLLDARPHLRRPVLEPYRGLERFESQDRQWFFGRERAVKALLRPFRERTVPPRGMLVTGASGVGKSSAVRAGLLPALDGTAPSTGGPGPSSAAPWTCVVTDADGDLREAAERSGLRGATADGLVGAVRNLSTRSPRAAPSAGVGPADAAPGRLLLVVDQWEQVLLRLQADGARSDDGLPEDVAQLLALIESDLPVTVVLVMRADFYRQFGDLAPDLRTAMDVVVDLPATLTAADLRAIVTRPAHQALASIQDGLAERIVSDAVRAAGARPRDDQAGIDDLRVSATVLPLLELALQRLWSSRHEHQLTHEAYEELGGVEGSLDNWCNATMAALPAAWRPVARRVLSSLVRPADPEHQVPATRQPRRLEELRDLAGGPRSSGPRAEAAVVDQVVDHLAAGRILVIKDAATGDLPGDGIADLVHESLIQDWQRLRDWVQEDARFQHWLAQAQQRASRWDATGDPGQLLRGADLESGQHWLRSRGLTEPVARLVTASRRRSVRATAVLSVLAVCAVLFAAASLVFARSSAAAERDALRQKAASQSRELASLADAVAANDPARSRLLAAAAVQLGPTTAAQASARNVLTRSRMVLLGHTAALWSVAFSPNGRILATTSVDGTVRLWDVVARRPLGRPMPGHRGAVFGLAFSPDGGTVASAGEDRTVRLWDVFTHRQVDGPLEAGAIGAALAFTPDGRRLVTGNDNGTLRVWDVVSRRPAGPDLACGCGSIRGLALTRDGRTAAAASTDGTVRLWDLDRSRPVTVLKGHTGTVHDVAFAPGGRLLASAGDDGTVRLWDLDSDRTVGSALLGHSLPVTSVGFAPDGRTLFSAGLDQTVRHWDVASGRPIGDPLTGHAASIHRLAVSPDGRLVATTGDDRTLRLWDTAGYRAEGEPLTGHGGGGVGAVAVSPQGTLFATAGMDGKVRLWELATRRPVGAPLAAQVGPMGLVDFSPDGRTLATGGTGGAVRLWDVATGQQVGEPLTGHSGDVVGVRFSPDGTTLASTGQDGTVRLWNVADHRQVGDPLHGHVGGVAGLSFSPDGTVLATGGSDATVRLWDVPGHRPLGQPMAGHTGVVVGVAFAPDGSLVASGSADGTVRLWDPATHLPVGPPLTSPSLGLGWVAFSPDGRTLATAGDDHDVRLWDLAGRRQIGPALTGHARAVNMVAFSPDGEQVLSTSADGTLRVWDATNTGVGTPGEQSAALCAVSLGPIGHEEWAGDVPGEPYRPVCPD